MPRLAASRLRSASLLPSPSPFQARPAWSSTAWSVNSSRTNRPSGSSRKGSRLSRSTPGFTCSTNRVRARSSAPRNGPTLPLWSHAIVMFRHGSATRT